MPALDPYPSPQKPAESTHSSPIPHPPDPLWPQWILLAAQALSIIISATGTRIWFQQPQPAGRLALTQMLALQLLVTATLAPALLENARSLIIAAAPMFLFDALAAWISGDEPAIFAGRWALMLCWMVCGWLWISLWRTNRGIAAAILQCAVLAPPILLYLAADWGDPNRLLPTLPFTPMGMFLAATNPATWATPATLAIALIAARLWQSLVAPNKLSTHNSTP
jgi:hypothetical protein